MSSTDNAGRVHRPALVASTLTLFALALVTLIVRLFIRIRLQKYFGFDDGFLLFAMASLCAATGLLFKLLNKMYLGEALITGSITTVPPDVIEQTIVLHKLSDAYLVLLWTTVCAVKFSFLALFRKLIDRNRPLTTYWNIAMTVNAVVWAYGVAGLVTLCPRFTHKPSLTCGTGSNVPRTAGLAALIAVLDILTDMSIIAIPVNLIWRIRVNVTQKLALVLSLCLSVAMIIVTIIRASGLTIKSDSAVDVVWELYWQNVEASVAVIMASLTAFRSLFVVRSARMQQPPKVSSYSSRLASVKKMFSLRIWRKASEERRDFQCSSAELHELSEEPLPQIPRAIMTGMRTFIGGQGVPNPLSMHSLSRPFKDDDADKLRTSSPDNHHQKIRVQHDLSLTSERASHDANQTQSHHEYV